ncbi:hypothetical protein MMP66_07970 [Acinetobacter dispersus]|uniref:hypothetical protein n=1 Tax=Acinetobacter dispersus TaxID=70348 RepID=UPI001F4B2708|nr:hypothetical protein [Acinetobacter dispersus]MCH7394216.1 hypothetical protein [Acinetobacter dispersus]
MEHNSIPSQTTARLYQHPTVEEQRPTRSAKFKANAIDIIKLFVLTSILWIVISNSLVWLFGG